MNVWMRRLVWASTVAACAWPVGVSAQGGAIEAQNRFEQEREEREAAIGTFVVVATVSSSVFTLGGATFANLKEDQLFQEKDELEKLVMLEMYLDEFTDDVRAALALGGGEELEHLTAFAGHTAVLSAEERARLRGERARIEAALSSKQTAALGRARAVRDVVRDVLGIPAGKEVSL